jgi:hypothetical protein
VRSAFFLEKKYFFCGEKKKILLAWLGQVVGKDTARVSTAK